MKSWIVHHLWPAGESDQAEEKKEQEIFRKNRTKLARQAAALMKEQAKP